MAFHSKIGASSYERWGNCPGSVRLSEGIPPTTSAYAEEGTLAHAAAAHFLIHEAWPRNEAGLTEEMKDAVAVYIDLVFEDRKKALEDNVWLVEHGFDLSHFHPGLFGTADAVLYHAAKLKLSVYDYKHGQGIPVEVVKDGKPNVQLMYYGLGALSSIKRPVEEVELVIVQPRCFHPDGPVRRVTVSAIEMLDFAADLVEAAKRTEDPNAPLHPGDHCRFCPASAICPSLNAKAVELARQEFSPVVRYEPRRLSEVLDWVGILEDWCKNVRSFAYAEAERGNVPPGYKLVEKQARRRWKDDVTAHSLSGHFQIPTDWLVKKELLSPAQVEKKVKSRKGELDRFTEKVSSGFNLVPERDKRPEVACGPASEFDVVTPKLIAAAHQARDKIILKACTEK